MYKKKQICIGSDPETAGKKKEAIQIMTASSRSERRWNALENLTHIFQMFSQLFADSTHNQCEIGSVHTV